MLEKYHKPQPKPKMIDELKVVTSGHVTQMVTPFDLLLRKPHAARKLYGSVVYRTGVIGNRNFTLR